MICERLKLKDYYPFLGDDGKDPFVDVYRPYNMKEMKRGEDKLPVMIVCPGGGYWFCSEREAEPIAIFYASKGYNAFVLNYSVKPHHFPSQIVEVAALFDLIEKNADKWNCNTEKIGIIGFSAGGHLAAHHTVCYDCKEVREYFPDSRCANALLLGYPVISSDFSKTHKGSIVNVSGRDENTSPEELEFFSCEKHVKDTTPPAFIWHTAADNAVPVQNSLMFANALQEKGISYELHIFPYGHHGLSTADKATNGELPPKLAHVHSWMDESVRWLDLVFGE